MKSAVTKNLAAGKEKIVNEMTSLANARAKCS